MASISDKVAQIRQAVYGKDVRESIASGIEAINEEVENTTSRQNVLETTFEQLIINAGNSNAEIVAARVNAEGTAYPTLGDRLNAADAVIKEYQTEIADARGGFDTLRKKLDSYAINVKDFGAKGDGETDDTLAIQAAINYFLEHGGTLFFPAGEYLITSPLECYRNGKYFTIKGEGRRASFIKAGAEMPYMIRLWDDDIYTATLMEDIGFLMEEYADIGIDAFKSVYSTFNRISIWTKKENSVCIKLSSWCNRLQNSLLYGNYDYDGNAFGIVPAVGILIASNLSTNNLIIEDNVFGQLGTAIMINDFGNDIHILKNCFDVIGKILVAPRGLKNCTFRYNYCERCGGVNDTLYDLEPYTYTDGNYSRTIHSPIILHEDVNMVLSYPVSINIEYNQFADCYREKLVAVSGVRDFRFAHNDFYGLTFSPAPYTYNNLIYVFGKGIYQQDNTKFFVENRYSSKIQNLIIYDNNYSSFYYNRGDIMIDNGYDLEAVTLTSKPSIKPKLGGTEIDPVGTDIIVNSTTELRVDYKLSDFDAKHPHKLIINVEKISGTQIICSVYAKPDINLIYNLAFVTGTKKSDIIEIQNERADRQYKDFYAIFKADGDVRILSVFLIVANINNRIIQII